jgi:hypothetical protein
VVSIRVVSWCFPGWAEEGHEELQREKSITRPRSEPGTLQREIREITASASLFGTIFYKKYDEVHVFWKLRTEFRTVKKSTGES